MENKPAIYDYFGLKNDNIRDGDIYQLGNQNVHLLNAQDAYTKYGNGEDQAGFQQKYDAVNADYLNFKKSAYLRDYQDMSMTTPVPIAGRSGFQIGQNSEEIRMATDQQIAQAGPVYRNGQVTNIKADDANAGSLVLNYKQDGTPFWNTREDGESVAGKEVNSVFGPSEMYSSFMNQAWSGLWNASIAELPSGVAGIGKVAGDLGEAIYNASQGKGWTASGTAPWDVAYNNSLAFSKSIQNTNSDQQNNMWYDFNVGLASLATAAAAGYTGAIAGEALGLGTGIGGGVQKLSRYASLGMGSMQVMDNFIEQSKAAGIPDADIAFIAPIIGSITAWSESKLGPDWIFNQYEKAGAKKIFQKEFIDPLIKEAETLGVASLDKLPKSAYARAVNNVSGSLGKLWNGVKAGEGVGYDFLKGAGGEGLEEFSEGAAQNMLMKSYDAFKVNYSTLTDIQKANLQKDKGLYFDKDFSLGQVYNDVTTGLGYQAFMGALTGGVANIGGSLYNKVMQKNAQQDKVAEAIVNGQFDEIQKALVDAAKTMPNYPGANWTDGQNAVTYDLNGTPSTKSVKDIVLEQTLANNQLMKELWDNSGISNPAFIKDQLGGDKNLAFMALQAIIGQKNGEQALAKLEQEKKDAQDKGTWTDPASPEQDTIAQAKTGIEEYKQRFQYISSGQAYSEKLKSGLVTAYAIKNTDKHEVFATNPNISFISNTPSQDADRFFETFSTARLDAIQKANDVAAHANENIATHSDRITELEKANVDQDFFAKTDSLLKDIRSYGSSPQAIEQTSNILKTKSQELAYSQNDDEEGDVTDESELIRNHINRLNEYNQELSTLSSDSPSAKYDENQFILSRYFPDKKVIESLDIDKADVDQRKTVLANENLIKPGGILDQISDSVKLGKQLAAVNHDVYSSIDDKHTKLDAQDKLTSDQYELVKKEAESLQQKISTIRQDTVDAVNDRNTEQKKINITTLKLNAYNLDYAIKMLPGFDDDAVKSYILNMHHAMDELAKGNETDEVIQKLEKAQTQIETVLHNVFAKDKGSMMKVIEAMITSKRPNSGYDLTNVQLMFGAEFLGSEFDKIYDIRSLQGQDKMYAGSYHEAFSVYYITKYFNTIKRVNSNDFVKVIKDILVAKQIVTPSYEQVQAVKEMAGWFMDPSNEWIKDYQKLRKKHNSKLSQDTVDSVINKLIKNALLVRGYAGAGKTSVLARLSLEAYLKMSGKTDLNVLHIAPTKDAIDNLLIATNAVTGKASGDAMTTFDFIKLTQNVTSKYDLVILDEASLFSQVACNKIRELQATGTKLMFIGDQSQVVSELSLNGTLPIEEMMERTTPITTSFRNSSVDINNLLSRYRKAIFTASDVVLPKMVHNQSETFGGKYYKTEAEIIKAFVNDIGQGTKSWIIVSDESRRTTMIDNLVKQGVNSLEANELVKTIMFDEHTAQGLQNKKVYVAIRAIDVANIAVQAKGMLNRMMLTAISRTGSKSTNIGFVGVLDESAKGISEVGKPIESKGIELDKDALIAKLTNMYTDALSTKQTAPVVPVVPAAASNPSTAKLPALEDKANTVKPPLTADLLKQIIDRINTNEKDLIKKTFDAFMVTPEQQAQLIKAQHNYDLTIREGDSLEHVKTLLKNGWPIDEINEMSPDQLKELALQDIKKIPNPIPFQDFSIDDPNVDLFRSSSNVFAKIKTLPINFFAVQPTSNINQENISKNKNQQDKIKWLSSNPKTVIIKYHPTLSLTRQNQQSRAFEAYEDTNVFGVWSDTSSNAIFLGTLFKADSGFEGKELGIDNIPYLNNESGIAKVKAEIENGFTKEDDGNQRENLIKYHTAIVDIKTSAAQNPNGVSVSISDIMPAQIVSSKDGDYGSLNEFKSVIEKYGPDKVKIGIPYQVTRRNEKGNNITSLAVNISFLGNNPDVTQGIPLELRMDNLTTLDVKKILIAGVETEHGLLSIEEAIEDFNVTFLTTSEAALTIDYNRSVLKQMLLEKVGVEKFINLDIAGLNVKLIGTSSLEKFKNLKNLWEFLADHKELSQRMFYYPAIIHASMKRNGQDTFNLKDFNEIANRIKVVADKENPLRFPTFTIDTTTLKPNGVATAQTIQNAQDETGSVDLNDFGMEHAKSQISNDVERINRDKATAIIRTLLGNTYDVRFSETLTNANGKALYGLAKKGYIALEDSGGVEITTPRHEVLHEIMGFALTPEYKTELLDAAKSVISSMQNQDITTITDTDAEEFMARQYGKTEGMPPHPLLAPIWRFLTWLKNLFISSKTDEDILNNFYSEIENGKYYGEVNTENSLFTEKEYAKDIDDINGPITDEERRQEEKKQSKEYYKNKDRFGDLYDYSTVAKKMGGFDRAEIYKPAMKRNIVRYMFPTHIMPGGKLAEPFSLFKTIKTIQSDYESQAKTKLDAAFINKVETEVTSENVREKITNAERGSFALYAISKDKTILYKYMQSIFPDIDIATLMTTADINKASYRTSQDTINKTENELVDITKTRTAFLNILLHAVPSNEYAYNNNKLEKVGTGKGMVDGDVLSRALEDAGVMGGEMNNFDMLVTNLNKIASELTYTDGNLKRFTVQGNAIMSFLEQFANTDGNVLNSKTWSYNYISQNQDTIEAQYPAYQNNELLDAHVHNASSIVNAIANSFASLTKINPMQQRFVSYYDRQEEQTVTKIESIVLRPTILDSIKNTLLDRSNKAIFASVNNSIVINPSFVQRLDSKYKIYKNNTHISVIQNGNVLMDIYTDNGYINVRPTSEFSEEHAQDMLKMLGFDLHKRAIDIFWNDTAKNVVSQKIGGNKYTKENLAQIAGTMLVAAKTITDITFKDDPKLVAVLNSEVKKAGSLGLDESTSQAFGTPSPADFYTMVEKLAKAKNAAIGSKYRSMYYTVDGSRAYAYVPGTGFDSDFKGGRTVDQDGALKKQAEFDKILESVDVAEFARKNPLISNINGVALINNAILTKDPTLHIRIGETSDNKGVVNDFKGNSYGKTATTTDVAISILNPFFKNVNSPTKHQTITLPSPTRSDSTQAQMINFYFPEGEVVSKNGFTEKGKEMTTRMMQMIFHSTQREVETSINRWADFMESIGNPIPVELIPSFYENPFAFRAYLKNTILPSVENLHDKIVFENSGLYENKDYLVRKINGVKTIDAGFNTLFNSEVEEAEDGSFKLKQHDQIFSYDNYQRVKNANEYEIANVIDSIYDPAFEDFNTYLQTLALPIELTSKPILKAFYALNLIIQNNLYGISLGHIGQYASIQDYFKRNKEAPGSVFQVGGKNGLAPTYRNAVLEDRKGMHHEQLERLGLLTPNQTTNGTDGLQLLSPTFQQELYLASGSELGPLGQGQYKLAHKEYNLKEGVAQYIKSSSHWFTEENIKLASTFGLEHLQLENKNNYFEETLQRMYSTVRLDENTPSLYEQFNIFRRQLPFKQATAEMVKFLKNNPHRRAEVNDVLTFKSAYKTTSKVVNHEAGTFENMVAIEHDSGKLRHQTTLDAETDDARASAVKQLFPFIGIGVHNAKYAEMIEDAEIEIANTTVKSIQDKIAATRGNDEKTQFQNYLRDLGQKSAISRSDYSEISMALSNPNISIEPSLLRNRLVRLYLKDISKAMRHKQVGIRVIASPALFSVYEGNDGNIYTLSDIAELHPDQVQELELQKAVGRSLHTDRIDEAAGKMLPAEIVGAYIHKQDFGILVGESLNRVMSITMNDGKMIRTDKMKNAAIKKFIEKNLDNINIEKTPMMRSSASRQRDGSWVLKKGYADVLDYRKNFMKSLEGMNVRVPSHGPGSAQYRTMVAWISDYSAIQYGNPLKNIMSGIDYDADQLTDLSFSRDSKLPGEDEFWKKKNTDNQILEGIVGFYKNSLNHAIINTPIDTSKEEDYAEELKKHMNLQPGAFDTSLKMYKLNNDGKKILDRFAISNKMYALGYKAWANDKSIFNGLNMNAQAMDNFNELVNVTTAKNLNMAADNAKLQVLGVIGANPESINTIMGILLFKNEIPSKVKVTNKFTQTADFLLRPHIKSIFNYAQQSQSINAIKASVFQVATQKLKDISGVILNAKPKENETPERFQERVEYLKSIFSDIELLIQLDTMGDAFMRLNNIFKLDSKGLSDSTDYQRYNTLHGLYGMEFTLGMPLSEYFKDGGVKFLKKNPDWFMTKRTTLPKTATRKFQITFEEEYEREKQIRSYVDYGKALEASPKLHRYVEIAYEADTKINSSFLIGGEAYTTAKTKVLLAAGYNEWMSEDMYKDFDKQFEKLVMSVYLNQTDYSFNNMDGSPGTFTLRTPSERDIYRRQFSEWLTNYKAQNTELVDNNSFLKKIDVLNDKFETYIAFPFKDTFTDDEKASIQTDAAQLKNAKYKFEFNGVPISNISVYDAFLLYQYCQEDFSPGKRSYLELLGESGLKDISLFIETKLLPSIKNNKALNLYDDSNKPIQKTFQDIVNDSWSTDIFNRGDHELLQKFSNDKLTNWKTGKKPTYIRVYSQGKYTMALLDDNYDLKKVFGGFSDKSGYSVDKSSSYAETQLSQSYQPTTQSTQPSTSVNKQASVNPIVSVQEMNLNDDLIKSLIKQKTITLKYQNPQNFTLGHIGLSENLNANIIFVSDDHTKFTIQLNESSQLNIPFSMDATSDVTNSSNVKLQNVKTIQVTNKDGNVMSVLTVTKTDMITDLANNSDNEMVRVFNKWILSNPALLAMTNAVSPNVIYVDPANLFEKTYQELMQYRKEHNDIAYTIAGGYNADNSDIYLNPLKAQAGITFTHELLHNLVYDTLKNKDTTNPVNKRYVDRMNAIFLQLKAHKIQNNLTNYGFDNVQEMVSEAFTNLKFQNELANIPSILQEESLWDSFLDAIRSFLYGLGFPAKMLSNTALGDIICETGLFLDVTSKLKLESYDIDYQKFIKNNSFVSKIDAQEYYDKCVKAMLKK